MSLHQNHLLIDHLDKNLKGTNAASNAAAASNGTAASNAAIPSDELTRDIQKLIAEDEDAAREWHCLNLAVDAIRDAGLHEQVGEVAALWKAQQAATPSAPAKIRSIYPRVMRVAACILILAGGASIFKYVTINSPKLYNEYYTPYDLSTSRGSNTQDAIQQAYAQKDWNGVLNSFNNTKEKNNKSDFLAGIADLELKKYDDAIAHFEQVMATNSQAKDNYFEDEAEYYLAISWLAKGKVNEAMPLLEKIRADKNHLYHQKVEKMSFLDLRLVQYKENK